MRTFLVLLFTTSLAYGQTQRTFVSAHTGSDANPCGPTTPCRSFGAAMALTLSGGEIIVLDSGGYGTVTIDKSVSIVSPAGVYAGVSTFSGTAITINTASLTIVLEGLTLNGLGGLIGIAQNAAVGTLYVKRCLITGFSDTGIGLGGNGAQLFLAETDIRNNGAYGVNALSNNRLTLDHVRIEKNGDGVALGSGVLLDAHHSVFAANTTTGVNADTGEANLESCLISGNVDGVKARFGTIRLSNCTITDNTNKGINGPLNPAGHIYSRQNNTIEGNAADDTPTMFAAK